MSHHEINTLIACKKSQPVLSITLTYCLYVYTTMYSTVWFVMLLGFFSLADFDISNLI